MSSANQQEVDKAAYLAQDSCFSKQICKRISQQKAFLKYIMENQFAELTDQQIQANIDYSNLQIDQQFYKQDIFKIGREKVKDKDAIDEHFICPICYNLAVEPVECKLCQTCFCILCLGKWSQISNSCPTCKQPCSINQLHKFARKQLNQYMIQCPWKCQEQCIKYENFRKHILTECGEIVIFCPNKCSPLKLLKKNLVSHLRICPDQIYACFICGLDIKLKNYIDHDCIDSLQQLVAWQKQRIEYLENNQNGEELEDEEESVDEDEVEVQ